MHILRQLTDLPPGTYTIEAWHEKVGTSTQNVTVHANEIKVIDFVLNNPRRGTVSVSLPLAVKVVGLMNTLAIFAIEPEPCFPVRVLLGRILV